MFHQRMYTIVFLANNLSPSGGTSRGILKRYMALLVSFNAHCALSKRTEATVVDSQKVRAEEISASIVVDIVEGVIAQGEATDDSSSDSDSDCSFIDPRVKARNERVALRDAEFRRLYPTFRQEVQALKVVRRRRRTEKVVSLATRKSQRILGLSVAGENEICAASDDEQADIEESNCSDDLSVANASAGSVGDNDDVELPN